MRTMFVLYLTIGVLFGSSSWTLTDLSLKMPLSIFREENTYKKASLPGFQVKVASKLHQFCHKFATNYVTKV